MPEWVEVRTQEELDAALAVPDAIPVCLADARFAVGGNAVVRAGESAHVTASGDATVEAWGDARVDVSDSVLVGAWERVGVTARGSARVEAWDRATVQAADSVAVRLWGWAEAEARGSVTVEAEHWTKVEARDEASVEAWGSASVFASGAAIVKAWDEARVSARDTARVDAWGSANVDAWGSATVRAWGSAVVQARGSATITALGSVLVTVRGTAKVTASDHVAIRRYGEGSEVTGGVVNQIPAITTAEDWCAFYGVDVRDGVATLFKAVDADFLSRHGTSYAPGSRPQASDWDGGAQDCGGGLHFAPNPSIALQFEPRAERFVACPVRVEDIAVSELQRLQDKVKAKGVCAPVYEVDQWAEPVNSL